MPRQHLPKIVAASAGRAPLTLRVRWSDGGESLIDVSGMIGTFRVFMPLRDDDAMFRRVHVGEYGSHVAWTEEIDMSADTLWRLAREQSGETISAEQFRAWRGRKAYTLESAAKALGLSRRMVAYYDSGEKPVPRTVALATRALEAGVDEAA